MHVTQKRKFHGKAESDFFQINAHVKDVESNLKQKKYQIKNLHIFAIEICQEKSKKKYPCSIKTVKLCKQRHTNHRKISYVNLLFTENTISVLI